MSNTKKNKDNEKKVIGIFNCAFFFLVIVLYAFVYRYINDLPNDMQYMNPLIIVIVTLFFGTPMKATYDILFNIYFDFEEDLSKYFKRGRVMLHSIIDFVSIAFTLIIVIKFINSFLITIAIAVFFVVCLVLGIYLYLTKKYYQKEQK